MLVLTSGGNRVDVVKVGRQRSSATVRKADAEEVQGGHRLRHRRHPALRPRPRPSGAGRPPSDRVEVGGRQHPRHVFPIAPGDLLRATGGQVANIITGEVGPPAGVVAAIIKSYDHPEGHDMRGDPGGVGNWPLPLPPGLRRPTPSVLSTPPTSTPTTPWPARARQGEDIEQLRARMVATASSSS